MSVKRAFLVLGPESSGTRLMARLFVAAGCYGDVDHKQRLDAALSNGEPIDAPAIVVRRSYPYAKQWPNLHRLQARLQQAGYKARAVVIIRSMQFTALSSQRQAHERKMGRAMTRSANAFRHIGQALQETQIPFVWVTYESLVQRPEQEVAWLFKWAGLPAPQVRIFDGNEKYV